MSLLLSSALNGLSHQAVPGRHLWRSLLRRWIDRHRHRDRQQQRRIFDDHVHSLLASHAGVRLVAILAIDGECLSSALGAVGHPLVDAATVADVFEKASLRSADHWAAGCAVTPIFPNALGNALCRRIETRELPLILLFVLDPRVGAAHAAWLGRYAAKELRSRLGIAQPF